jgi:hypothetical protein
MKKKIPYCFFCCCFRVRKVPKLARQTSPYTSAKLLLERSQIGTEKKQLQKSSTLKKSYKKMTTKKTRSKITAIEF